MCYPLSKKEITRCATADGQTGIYALFPLSRPTLQKGAAKKNLDKNYILFSPIFAIFTILEQHYIEN